MEQQERSKMLGTMPMSRLVPKVSVPIMISMLVQALYNVVDGIFVARYSADAFTAVSLVFPVQMLMIAVSTGLGVGINSLISRRLGEKKPKEALFAAKNGIFLELCGVALFCLFGLFGSKIYMSIFTDDATLRQLGEEYLRIVTIYSLGLFMSVVFERMLQATGNTTLSMSTQLLGAITNIILDPIMIFGLCGCPAMGIAGAAWATVIGQIFSALLGLVLNQWKNQELKLNLHGWKPELRMMGNILTVGLPSTVMASISSVLTVLMNQILIAYGAVAVNVLGVYFKLQSFVFMPVFGLSNGMVPIVGYNYGAKNRQRVYSAIKVALTYAIVIMAVGMLLFLLVPDLLLGLFESNGPSELTTLGVPALRIISLSFILAAVGITLSTVFQAVGKGSYSLTMSLCRQLVVLLPAAWILSALGGLNAIWWAFPIAEVVSLVICLALYRKCDREMLKPLGQ